MPIDRDVPLDWDALPDPVPTPPPARLAWEPHASPEALTAQERIELDTLRSTRDHYQQVAVRLKTDLDVALKRLKDCTCNQSTPRQPTRLKKS